MKILVATNEKQVLSNDFCWTDGNEIVKLPALECSNPDCGCDRSWVGTKSSKSTTTAKVVQSETTVVELAKIIYNSRVREGWIKADASENPKKEDMEQCRQWANKIYKITKCRKIGTIVRRKGQGIFNA
jgi:hypothetical protein